MKLFELNQLYCDLSEWTNDLQKAKEMLLGSEAKAPIKATIEKIERKRKRLRKDFARLIPKNYLQAKADPDAEIDLLLDVLEVQEDFRSGNEAAILHLLVQVFQNVRSNYPVALLSSYEISCHIYENLSKCKPESDLALLTEWLVKEVCGDAMVKPWFQGLRKKLIERHRFLGFSSGQPLDRQTHELMDLYCIMLGPGGGAIDWKSGVLLSSDEAALRLSNILDGIEEKGLLSKAAIERLRNIVKYKQIL